MLGCVVCTMAEIAVEGLPDWGLARVKDAETGFLELMMRRVDVI